jgi:hypothetical protein
MRFFEPEPPPPEPKPRQWSPPAWDRPSEGTLPWMVPISAIVHQDAKAVILIESVAAYPNGFVVNIVIRTSPHLPPEEVMDRVHQPGARFPRIGVRFSDGQMAGQEASTRSGGPRPTQEIPKDAEGLPTKPIVRMTGGGGGGGGWRFGVWIYPLPPQGPLEIFVSLPLAGLDEGIAVLDGKEIRDASHKAIVVWD